MVRSIAIPVLYVAMKVQSLIPLLVCFGSSSICSPSVFTKPFPTKAIAVVSTILMGVKIALLATLGKASMYSQNEVGVFYDAGAYFPHACSAGDYLDASALYFDFICYFNRLG